MSALVAHAIRELDRAGIGDEDADYDGMLKKAVLEIVEIFSSQGHTGHSAAVTVAMVEKLLRFEPLSPLTGDADEWVEIDPAISVNIAAQNIRCSRVFRRHDGTSFDVEGRVFRERNGTTYLDARSAVDVTFPYTPATELIDEDG